MSSINHEETGHEHESRHPEAVHHPVHQGGHPMVAIRILMERMSQHNQDDAYDLHIGNELYQRILLLMNGSDRHVEASSVYHLRIGRMHTYKASLSRLRSRLSVAAISLTVRFTVSFENTS